MWAVSPSPLPVAPRTCRPRRPGAPGAGARPDDTRRRSDVAVGLVALLVALVGAGCAGDDGGGGEHATPPQITVQVPDVVDETCTDPVGDISSLATVEGTASEPAGIDLVAGEVHLDETTLSVRFETNGEIAEAPSPTFTLFQGPPAMQGAWEVRLVGSDGGWDATLYTYGPGEGNVTVAEQSRPLEVSPVVEGGVLSYELPRSSVPPPLTLAWVWGTTSGQEAVDGGDAATDATVERPLDQAAVFDECNELFD